MGAEANCPPLLNSAPGLPNTFLPQNLDLPTWGQEVLAKPWAQLLSSAVCTGKACKDAEDAGEKDRLASGNARHVHQGAKAAALRASPQRLAQGLAATRGRQRTARPAEPAGLEEPAATQARVVQGSLQPSAPCSTRALALGPLESLPLLLTQKGP